MSEQNGRIGAASAPKAARVLLVTPQPFYEDRGTPIAIADTCRALSELGYETDVLAFPLGQEITIPGVTIHRCSNPFRVRSVRIGFSMGKCLLDATLLASFEHLLRTQRYDVVHAVEEAAYIASLLCPRFGKPFIYDMASSIPAELRNHRVLGRPLVQRCLAAVERGVLERASHVICSRGLGDHVHDTAPGVEFTEWRFPAVAGTADAGIVAKLKLNLDIPAGARVVMYSGNFANYQGLDLLFDAFAAALSVDPSLLLVCIGASDEARSSALALLDPQTRARVRILTRQPRSSMPAYFALADCLISLRPNSHNLPLKVFDYMAAGKPIVATKGPAHEPLLNGERAFMCDPRAESVTAAILDVFQPASRGQQIAHSARLHAQRNFGWSRFVGLVDGLYESVLGHDGVHRPLAV